MSEDRTKLDSILLFACPFCGWKEPKYLLNGDMWEGMMHDVHCYGCDTTMSDYSKDQVIAKWNTRFEANIQNMP